MRSVVIFGLSLLLSCSGKKDRIIVPELRQDFYSQALLRIDSKLEGNESDLQLIEQKLYYCERLDWPETCIDALEALKSQKGMTPQLLDQFITYYLNHERYRSLLETVEKWAGVFDKEKELLKVRILALTKLNRKDEALGLLGAYMTNKASLEDIEFAANQYLSLKDTLFSTYYLSKLYKMDNDHPLIYQQYADLLIALGRVQKGLEILERYAQKNEEDYTFRFRLASIYEQYNQLKAARENIKPFAEKDTVVYWLAGLYAQENKWDSAHYYINQIIERDSSNKKAWWTKARLYEDQGWLSYSLNYFDHVTYLDPSDTVALKRAASIRRKIAYLQRLKFEEQKIEVPVIEPKKIENNNE